MLDQAVPKGARSDDERLRLLDDRLEALDLEGHWRLGDPGRGEPAPASPPHLWRWTDLRSLLTEAGDIRAIAGHLGRRTVRLCTPGLGEKWTTRTIHASVQLVKPGEVAAAHRHSMPALRFVLEGDGGYTTVEGVKIPMEPGDLILTPAGAWHDHSHDGDRAMMWIDGHDFPFTNRLNALFFQNYAQPQQAVTSVATSSGPYVFKGSASRERLAATTWEGADPCWGPSLTYADPRGRGPTLPTIACRLTRIEAARPTLRHRRTANVIYHVVAGSGTTRAGETELRWGPGDLFVVPGWTWQQHAADSGDAILFSMSDEAILERFGLLRIETEQG